MALAHVRIRGIDAGILPLNLGCNTFGWTSDEQVSHRVLDAFLDGGGNFLDTADMYSQWIDGNSGGESETVIGTWLAARGNRDQVVIATKGGSMNGLTGLDEATITTAVEGSLRRLGTDHIDLYYAHHDDEDTPIEEQARVFDALVQAGKIGAIGLSNHSPARTREWFETAARLGLTPPAALQPHWNLVHRADYEQGYRPVVEEFGPAVLPYLGLASGFLTGKYRTAADLAGASRGGAAQAYLNADGLAVVAALTDVAQARQVEPATVALAWLRARGATAPIASVSRPEQLPALLASAALELNPEELTRLDSASEPFL